MKDLILEAIARNNGIKSVELVIKVMSLDDPSKFDKETFLKDLVELVASGEIIELTYQAPEMSYRLKSIYFTGDTKIVGFSKGSHSRFFTEGVRY